MDGVNTPPTTKDEILFYSIFCGRWHCTREAQGLHWTKREIVAAKEFNWSTMDWIRGGSLFVCWSMIATNNAIGNRQKQAAARTIKYGLKNCCRRPGNASNSKCGSSRDWDREGMEWKTGSPQCDCCSVQILFKLNQPQEDSLNYIYLYTIIIFIPPKEAILLLLFSQYKHSVIPQGIIKEQQTSTF